MQALIDTHCHIHDSEYDFLIEDVLKDAKQAGVANMICVGTDLRSSFEALEFAQNQADCYASLGLHPHLAVQSLKELEIEFKALKELALINKANRKLVAIGECGLDYFYHSHEAIRQKQRTILAWHLQLAQALDLPLIFHVRQAYDDFWPIYSQSKQPAVLHSFADTPDQVQQASQYEHLYFGLNGIMTFSQDEAQLAAAQLIPEAKLLLETDAPYLTPKPLRGKINKPEYLRIILDFLAQLRQAEPDILASRTTENARALFKF